MCHDLTPNEAHTVVTIVEMGRWRWVNKSDVGIHKGVTKEEILSNNLIWFSKLKAQLKLDQA